MIAAAVLQSGSLNLSRVDVESFAQLSASRLLNCTVEGIVIALLAWALLRLLGRQNSGTRFAVWFLALVGIAALPFLSHFGSDSAAIATSSPITMPVSWAFYLFAGWVLIAGAGLVRIGLGFWRLRQLRKGCVPIDAALDPLLRKTLEEFDSPRSVSVCISDQLRVPTAIGFIKPLVVIPSWTMQELSASELNTILLHELAHLRRWDDWTNLIQKVLGALLFFHPAVWWIEKKLELEREMACDDLVLAKAASPQVYAECLVSLAEKSLLRRGLALAQAAVGRMRHMSLRVAQILDKKRPGATRVWRPAPVLLTGMSLACLMVFSDAPRLVSFADSPANSTQTSTLAASTITHRRIAEDENSVSPTGAQVVPAKFIVRTNARAAALTVSPGKAMNSVSAAKKVQSHATKSAVVPAVVKQRRVNQPTLIRSSMSEDAVAPQTLILVVQSARYDVSGAVVWDFCVWRVTVVGPAQNRLEPGMVAKST
jgi:beta-lactamase regulating signal transducer with metallopeptidase domain